MRVLGLQNLQHSRVREIPQETPREYEKPYLREHRVRLFQHFVVDNVHTLLLLLIRIFLSLPRLPLIVSYVSQSQSVTCVGLTVALFILQVILQVLLRQNTGERCKAQNGP